LKAKIIRITTVPISLGGLLKGQLKYMTTYFEVIGIASSDNNLIDKIAQQEEIQVIPVEMTRKITPLQDLIAVWELYKIFKQQKPEIVHTHTPKAGTLGMLAAFLAGVPIRLHTIAGLPLLETKGNKRRLLNLVEKFTYKFATKIYPNSFGLKEIILKHKFTPASKLKVLGNGSSNGINTKIFNHDMFAKQEKENLKQELGILESDYVFIFVGRLVKDKGINELVNAFDKLNLTNKNIKLLLVGTYENDLDPLEETTQKIIENNKAIIVTGWQSDVRPYLCIANVLTFPSYREGFPNVVMQAGAMGLPSIVTNINGCNEIIIDKLNGVIIPVKNETALLKEMRLFLEGYYSISKDKIRQNIVDKYEQEYVWQHILAEYNQLLKVVVK
jgi:glycosyltransferase involved in cell wall biosynthesis